MDGGRAFCLIFCALIFTGYSIESYPLRIAQPSLNIIPKFYSISLKKSINLTDRKSKKFLLHFPTKICHCHLKYWESKYRKYMIKCKRIQTKR